MIRMMALDTDDAPGLGAGSDAETHCTSLQRCWANCAKLRPTEGAVQKEPRCQGSIGSVSKADSNQKRSAKSQD